MATGELTGGLQKRQLGLDNVDVDELIKAMRNPSVHGFQQALNLLQAGNQQRFSSVLEAAREQAAAVGDADLRRLKRQFSSLKNTFLHYEVKDEFIAALSEGFPNGTEQAQLEQFEAEVAKNVDALRSLKAQNESGQAAIGDVIAQITRIQEAFERQRQGVAADLVRLQQDVAAHEAELGAPLPELGTRSGPGEEECMPGLEAAGVEMRVLEAQIAAVQAEEERLEEVIARDREEVEALRAHLAELETATAAEGERAEANTRFVAAGEWAEQMAGVITALSGVSLLHAEPQAVHLKLLTAYPTGPVAGEEVGPCLTGDHELSIALAQHGTGGSGAVASAQLHPADIDVTEVVEAARANRRRADFVVAEVQARLGALLHWRALVAEAAARYPVTAQDAEQATLRAVVAPGVEAEIRVVRSWPAGEDVVQVVAVSGATDAARAESLAQLQLRGRGLAQALDAVRRELEA